MDSLFQKKALNWNKGAEIDPLFHFIGITEGGAFIKTLYPGCFPIIASRDPSK